MMALHVVSHRLLWSLLLLTLLFAGVAARAQATNLSFDASDKVEQCTIACFVDAVNGDDANSGATPATAKRTIQAAVDAVQPGGEVHVSPGVYVEQVVIPKSLRLLGAGKATETRLLAPDDIPHAESPDSAILTIAGADVEVEVTGLTIAGPGPSICGSIGAGIFVRDGAHADIHGNIVRDIRDQPMSGCHYGVAIQVGRSSLKSTGAATIRANEILGYQKNGITISGVGSNALIEANTIRGAGPTDIIAQNGVQVSDGASAILNGNTISGHSYSPLETTSSGLLVLNADADTAGNTFVENQISIYHIDGNGVHNGNRVRATQAGVHSSAFWGIVADDPPPWRKPSPFDIQPTETTQDAEGAAVGAASANTKTIRVINNELESDGSVGGFALEADGGYGQKDIDFTATNNIVRNWFYGVVIFQCREQPHCTDAGFVNVTVQLNSIAGNGVGLYSNANDFAVDSTLNWWGAPGGPGAPGADAIVGSVNSTPWLCDGADTDSAVGFQPNLSAVCDGLGDLTVTHIIDWNGAPPVDGQGFEVCISGPAYPSNNCQTTAGGAVTWNNIQVGDYTVAASEAGPEWAVTLPDGVSVGDTAPAQATVTHTLRTGTLTVLKTVNWQGAPPADNIDFEICVSGPSYPSARCQNTRGGELSFGPLMPGEYTVSETTRQGWLATIKTPTVTIAPSQTVRITVENKYVGPMLACPLLDNFNRANTNSGLGRDWAGATNTYRISSNQVQAFSTASTVFWNRTPFLFGPDQVACVQLAPVNPFNGHFTLILKAQNINDYSNGMILVYYNTAAQQAVVETIEPGQVGWAERLAIEETFAAGDVLGARASTTGWVFVYRNNVLIGAAPTSHFFTNRGGRIGFWLFESEGARIDDFGGGNTPSSMVSAAGDSLPDAEEVQGLNIYLPTVQR
jgi:hypothetical protein